MRKVYLSISAVILLAVAVITGCSKSNEVSMSNSGGGGGTTPGGGGGTSTCDTANVKYSTVQTILQTNCYSCHGNGATSGGVSLDSYDKAKTQAARGALVGTITGAAGYPMMPRGGAALSACDINKIKAWISQGTPNN